MFTENCSTRFPFACFVDNLLLVKEKMTWQEAMEFCQAQTSEDHQPYQLVSVQPGDDYSYMMHKVLGADTDEVRTRQKEPTGRHTGQSSKTITNESNNILCFNFNMLKAKIQCLSKNIFLLFLIFVPVMKFGDDPNPDHLWW